MRQDVGQIINNTKIDKMKLPEAMRIIDRAASIMEECDYDTDPGDESNRGAYAEAF
ncbi:MAG: hypothetical protein K2N00_10040 [Lachnospiraceae bacterium]|nr:hypothetical protein [Lachnospiraceae bacterium]